MPSIAENISTWNCYHWPREGEEWSPEGSESQWENAILPHIQPYLREGISILEIATGFGRWTQYLKNYCGKFLGIDLTRKCVEACQKKFGGDPRMSFFQNDGRSLAMVQEKSVDFVFSFDSMVHVAANDLKAYLDQIAGKLTPDGVGFIHHSNLGKYPVGSYSAEKIHWRDPLMTAEMFADHCKGIGLRCIQQNLIEWRSIGMILDCFSLITPCGSKWLEVPSIKILW